MKAVRYTDGAAYREKVSKYTKREKEDVMGGRGTFHSNFRSPTLAGKMDSRGDGPIKMKSERRGLVGRGRKGGKDNLNLKQKEIQRQKGENKARVFN